METTASAATGSRPAVSAFHLDDPREVDVMVIGGGPAGTTAAATLVEMGWSVALADKDVHPRFHIGESLLPLNLPLFDRLGVREQVEAIGIRKYAAEFTSMQHGKTVRFLFGNAVDKSLPYAYQVRRSEFDKILLDNARAKGVEVIEGCRVAPVEFRAGERSIVRGRERDGTEHVWHARYVIDATGRDTLLANQLKTKQKHPKHASSALYGHFTNAKRHCGQDEGNISIYWFDHGWFWFIPLRDGTTSVGAVCWPYYLRARKVSPTQYLLDTIKTCPPLAERLVEAELTGPATATGNYSYMSSATYGDGFLMVGDAFGFVDPVFSGGVYIAMSTGFKGAETVDAILRDPAVAPRVLPEYDRYARHGIRQFSWFIFRMTSPSLREMFMDPRNVFGIEEALMSMLAGDIFRNPSIVRRLAIFKALYYTFNLFSLRKAYAAWKRRKLVIRTAAEDASASTSTA